LYKLTTELQQRFIDAVNACLRPLARLLLKAGVTYRQFDEMMRQAFINESFNDRNEGRVMTTSRVAVRTGLSRKEIARYRQGINSGESTASPYQIGRPARALQLWYSESEYLDDLGNPKDLPFDGDEPNFTTLVRRVGGDVPVGAVRAELLAAGGVIELSNGRLRAQKRFFVPSAFDEDLVVGFAFIVAPLLETLEHNLDSPAKAFIQRVSYSDHLPADLRQQFTLVSHERAEKLMNETDNWLAEREVMTETAEDATKRIGVGVFFFDRASTEKK
jgi:hypothetical protein